ncbi:SAM-dependent methyltransferase [Saccharopolyspora gloriosae]|uniref:SAM-dependent methyltransferase n=1 Tax=Saccharopolyspora gloriosae TaxID=455344 RepID=A0A840N7F8_9PSEU|nr:SAM-dependent methyltransferase [Saccharopolyspora gloriosae]MBB5067574.1 SAM-dependent methyltransferase [Saccharopolyspora gloriosae]
MSDRPGVDPVRRGWTCSRDVAAVDSTTGPLDMRLLNTRSPSVARCFDALLGGKDNYAVDRAVVDAALEVSPGLVTATVDHREWLMRVVRYLAQNVGIDQFLDIGSGLPAPENTHQVAQRANPDAVVVYVDHDPMVHSHGQALLADNDHTHFAFADLTRPAELLAMPAIARNIDLSRPVALLQGATLQHVSDGQRPHRVMAEYVAALAPGSYVAVSHLHRPEEAAHAETAARLEKLMLAELGTGWFRDREEITALFDGTEITEPGLTRAADWWPDGPRLRSLVPAQNLLLCGVGRKP